MHISLTTSERVMLLAAVGMLASLPLLARGSFLVWFTAQGLYFIGLALTLMKR